MLASDTYLERKRMIVPVDYAPKKKSLVDTVIDIKKEKIDALKESISTLHMDLQNSGHPIDISEDDVIESAIIILDADENIDQSTTVGITNCNEI